jgi:hypothetical protein
MKGFFAEYGNNFPSPFVEVAALFEFENEGCLLVVTTFGPTRWIMRRYIVLCLASQARRVGQLL